MIIPVLAISCVIVIIVVYLTIRRSVISENCVGYYQAPPGFARESGVSSLDVIITDVTLLGNIEGLIMADDDVYPFTFGISGYHRMTVKDTPVVVTCDESLGIPKRACLSITHGKLILEDDETVYIAAEWMPVF